LSVKGWWLIFLGNFLVKYEAAGGWLGRVRCAGLAQKNGLTRRHDPAQ